MAEETKPKPVAKPEIADLVRQLTAIADYAQRKAFYLAHPELAALINPCNYSH